GKATELILTAMGHSASTDSAKQRAGQLMTIIEARGDAEYLEKARRQQAISGDMETILLHLAE
ncbi:MAG: hypothetical protein EDM79_14750, partial [Chloroflexi bacterium]